MSNIQGTDGWYKASSNKNVLQKMKYLRLQNVEMNDGDIVEIQQCEVLSDVVISGVTFTGRRVSLKDLVPFSDAGAAEMTAIAINTCPTLSGQPDLAPDVSWQLFTELTDIDLSGNSFTATEVDAILIGLADAAGGTPGMGSGDQNTIVLTGDNAARTSASDAAVTALQAVGYTVLTTA